MSVTQPLAIQPPLEASFCHFAPTEYLNEYYSAVDAENDELLRFYAEVYASAAPINRLLEFGGGPTVYALISAARRTRVLDFSDFLPANLDAVRAWKAAEPTAFNWNHFVRHALEFEQRGSVSDGDVRRRVELVRSKLRHFLPCDAFREPPVEPNALQPYDALSVNFVPESITGSREQWFAALRNICSLLSPGGLLVLTCLKQSTYYRVGPRNFPAVSIDEHDLMTALACLGFPPDSVRMKNVPADCDRGYPGMILLAGRKVTPTS